MRVHLLDWYLFGCIGSREGEVNVGRDSARTFTHVCVGQTIWAVRVGLNGVMTNCSTREQSLLQWHYVSPDTIRTEEGREEERAAWERGVFLSSDHLTNPPGRCLKIYCRHCDGDHGLGLGWSSVEQHSTMLQTNWPEWKKRTNVSRAWLMSCERTHYRSMQKLTVISRIWFIAYHRHCTVYTHMYCIKSFWFRYCVFIVLRVKSTLGV